VRFVLETETDLVLLRVTVVDLLRDTVILRVGETVGDRVHGLVVGIADLDRVSVVDLVRLTQPLEDLVQGRVVAIAVRDVVTHRERVQGLVVAMPVIERLTVLDLVRVTEPV